MFKKLLITGGIALAGYVINEVRKQYDKNVNDYNELVDRYNEMSDFMDNCNFLHIQESKGFRQQHKICYRISDKARWFNSNCKTRSSFRVYYYFF